MVKTYRKKNSMTSGGALLRPLMLVVVSFFSGYMIASFVSLKQVGEWLGSMAPAHSKLVSAPQLAQHDQKAKPKLEFYTLLTTNHNAAAVPLPPSHPAAATSGVNVSGSINSPNTVIKADPAAHPTVITSSVAQVEHTNIDTRSINPQAKAPEQKSASTNLGYSIQVAALRNRQDAERMKATFLMRGLEVNIRPIASNKVIWYRVMVGSYVTRAQAEKMRMILARRDRVNGMIRKMDA